MLKWIAAILLVLLLGLQYQLWVGEGSLAHMSRLNAEIAQKNQDNDRLQQRNEILQTEVRELKSGLEAIEERARNELGMIKEGETFYLLIDEPEKSQ